MSKFPNKTPFELRQYFTQFNLAQLIEINRSYGPHFIAIEERLDRCNKTLSNEKRNLAQLEEREVSHQQKYTEVEICEEQFQSTLKAVLDDTDQTDRLLGRKSMGYSPMNIYTNQSTAIMDEISRTSQTINNLNETIADLVQKKRRAISELRILNSIIDEKERLTPEQPKNQLDTKPYL